MSRGERRGVSPPVALPGGLTQPLTAEGTISRHHFVRIVTR
jgi:hypothetical protein